MQKSYPRLNFPSVELKTVRDASSGTLSVWVPTRRCYLQLTPEEWVRRHVVAYLVGECGAEPEQICEEYPVSINSQAQRADIVVVDACAKPYILVECKAASVPLSAEVYAQAVRYNAVVGAPYIIITNGVKHLCFSRTESGYKAMNTFPHL